MIRTILTAVAVLSMCGFAYATELDSHSATVTNSHPNLGLVFRVDTRDNSVAVATSNEKITNESQIRAFVSNANFRPVARENVRSELDNTGGRSSWYYHRGYYGYGYPYYGGYYPYYGYGYGYGGYYPYYYYYGNYYRPYYCYGWGFYGYCGY